jgi:hypothetical protein
MSWSVRHNPVQGEPTSQKPSYRIEAFTIDIAGHQAICPGGFKNTQCSRLEESATHRVKYRFAWSTHCHGCAFFTECVGSEQRHRTIVVGENYDLLQARRIDSQFVENAGSSAQSFV